MSTARTARTLSLIALIIAAILSPTQHVPTIQRHSNYAVVFCLDHSIEAPSPGGHQLVAPTPHPTPAPAPSFLPAFISADHHQSALPAREITSATVSASPDPLSRFQRPPPSLQI